MKKLRMVLFALVSASVFMQCSNKPADEPLAVIFDTDVGNDIDDVLALQMLLNYEKETKINLLGITISKANPRVIDYVDAYCRFNNRSNIPLGYVYNGVNPEAYKYVPVTLDTIIDGKKILHPKRTIKDNLPEGYKLQRKLLASQKDNSVVMIVVGPETNIARLLNSQADEYSDLNGVELVKKKVRFLSIMGGLYSDEFDFPEWNIIQDLKASQVVFEKWPVELIASGWELGNKMLYPHQSILNDFADSYKHPLCVSYKVYQPMPYDRQTWDLTSVLYAVQPDKNYFELSPKGTITIDSTGKSVFTPGGNGKHRYLKIKEADKERTLQAMVGQVTGKGSASQ